MLEKLAAKGTPGVQYGKVNVDHAGGLVQKYGVRGIPDTRIFYKGRQVGQFVGYRGPGEIQSLVKRHLSKVKPARSSARPGASESSNGYPPGIQPVPAS